MRYRPFLLLEVLIAMTILTLAASTLIRQPILLHRAEVEQLENIEADRIASLTFTEIYENFLKGTVPWSQIPALKKKSKSFALPDAPFQIPPLLSRSINRSYVIETLREKQTDDGRIHRLLSIHIQIGSGHKKRQFSYQLNVEHST